MEECRRRIIWKRDGQLSILTTDKTGAFLGKLDGGGRKYYRLGTRDHESRMVENVL